MRGNQGGFMYPISLCLLLIFSTFLVIYTEQYINEKKISRESETILIQEYYFLHSIRMFEKQLQNSENISNSGRLLLQEGQVDFTKEDLGSSFKITLTITLNTGVKAFGYALYDKNAKKMINWIETN
jgi:hypothetical protein